MFRTGLVCLVLAGLATAQTSSPPVLTPRSNTRVEELPVNADSVAPDAPVITIKDVCTKPSGANTGSADCQTVITRSQFEKLINGLRPNIPKAQQKQIAARYVQLLILANKAQELGLDKGPAFDEQMYVQRLQVLASFAGEHMQKEAGQVSDAEIESFYRAHSADFRTISYDKIYVPKQKQAEPAKATTPPNGPDAQKKREAAEAEMKAEADKLRARAASGEDFVKLQQEAWDLAGLKAKASADNTHAEKVAKNRLPPSDSSIFELKKGDVSPVLNDAVAFMIYKVDDFQDQPLDSASVKEEISHTLQSQKLKTLSEQLQKSVVENTTYNDAYFAVPAAPSLRNPGTPATPTPGDQASPAPGKK